MVIHVVDARLVLDLVLVPGALVGVVVVLVSGALHLMERGLGEALDVPKTCGHLPDSMQEGSQEGPGAGTWL